MSVNDPGFWRAGAISTTVVMLVMLVLLTVDTYGAIETGGRNVPPYDVINRKIGYEFDAELGHQVPTIGGEQLLFGRKFTPAEAKASARLAKYVIQSRACMLCHTFFGNGSYYAPDLTKSWLDPAWSEIWIPMTEAPSREEAMVKFLMHPDEYPAGVRTMPNLGLSREEAMAVVAYLKWMSSVKTNGFPANFGAIKVDE